MTYEEKQKYLDDEPIFSSHPDLEKIECKDCVFRLPDEKLGKSVISGATNSMCEVYSKGVWKPSEILWDGAHCAYYVSEKED